VTTDGPTTDLLQITKRGTTSPMPWIPAYWFSETFPRLQPLSRWPWFGGEVSGEALLPPP